MSKSYPIYTVDAFTEKPYAGNPAAVCLTLDDKLEDEQYLKISSEMNLSETAFVSNHPEHTKDNPIFNLRWFTPKNEVNLCGHATLATAHVIFNEAKLVEGDLVLFETLSGILKVKRNETILQLDFPRGFPMNAELAPLVREKVMHAFGLHTDNLIDYAFCVQTKKLILELQKPSQLKAAKVPSASKLMAINYNLDVRGIALTCCAVEQGWKEESDNEALQGVDFATRYFSPWNGIPEDPVNGSSHTILPYYYTKKLGKTTMKSYAASPRGGYLTVSILEDFPDRIFISGPAATVLSGKITL